MNNSTMLNADRSTHVKVVVVALMASIAVIAVGLAAHTSTSDTAGLQAAGPAVKAGKPMAVTHSDTSAIR